MDDRMRPHHTGETRYRCGPCGGLRGGPFHHRLWRLLREPAQGHGGAGTEALLGQHRDAAALLAADLGRGVDGRVGVLAAALSLEQDRTWAGADRPAREKGADQEDSRPAEHARGDLTSEGRCPEIEGG